MDRTRGFCFTINNYTVLDMAQLIIMTDRCRFLICGFEVGTDNNVPHIQGYVYFTNQKYIREVSNYIPRAHIEVARANGSKAYRRADYCKKDGDFWEFGEEPHPGEVGKEYLDFIMANPYENVHLYNQYRKMHESLQLEKLKKKHDFTRKIVFVKQQDKYPFLELHDTVCMDADTYHGEELVIHHSYNIPTWIHDWYNGYPHKIKYGYEYILIDPVIVAFTYSCPKELYHLMNILPRGIKILSINIKACISNRENKDTLLFAPASQDSVMQDLNHTTALDPFIIKK